MELKFVILSVACFSCLITPALSLNLLAAKAVAGQAVQDVASIGINTLAAKKAAITKAATDIASIAVSGVVQKGQALKTAASSIVGAMLNGALSMGSTIAKAKLNLISSTLFGGSGSSAVVQPSYVLQEEEDPVIIEFEPEIELPVQVSPVSSVSVDIRPQEFSFGSVPAVEVVEPAHAPFVYEIVETPRVFKGPLIETFQFGK